METKSTIATAPPQYGTPPPQNNPQFNPQNPQFNPQNPQFNPQNPQFNPQNPQFNPQYNPQFSPQYNPQFNPQFSPQISSGQPTPYPPQAVYPQTVQPNPNVVLVQVPGGGNPAAICSEHGHIPVVHYGALGIFLAIFCFPLGIIALFMDRRTTCNRCGAILSV